MQLLLLTFLIAVLNLCLGYALAVHLGYGPPTFWNSWDALQAQPPAADISLGQVVADEDLIAARKEEKLESGPLAEPELNRVDALHRSVDKAIANLTEFSGGLRHGRSGQSGKTAWSFVGELQEICAPYVRHLSKVAERLCDEDCNPGEETAFSDEVEQIALEQMAQLETTLSNLQYMDFDSGFSAAMTRLRTDTANTLSVARRLQKALEAGPKTTDDEDAGAAVE